PASSGRVRPGRRSEMRSLMSLIASASAAPLTSCPTVTHAIQSNVSLISESSQTSFARVVLPKPPAPASAVVIPTFLASLARRRRTIWLVSSGRGTNAPVALDGTGALRDLRLVLGAARQTSSPIHAVDSPARIAKISQLQLDVNRFTA